MSTYRYATRQQFAGQALAQGMTVLVKVGSAPGPDPAVVFSIDEEDVGRAQVSGAGNRVKLEPNKFVATVTEEDLLALAPGEWTWLPSV